MANGSRALTANAGQMAVFYQAHNVSGVGTLSASTTTWSATAGAINVRLAALLEEPTGLPIDVGLGTLGATGRTVTLGLPSSCRTNHDAPVASPARVRGGAGDRGSFTAGQVVIRPSPDPDLGRPILPSPQITTHDDSRCDARGGVR